MADARAQFGAWKRSALCWLAFGHLVGCAGQPLWQGGILPGAHGVAVAQQLAQPSASCEAATLEQALTFGRTALLRGEHAAAEACFVRAETQAPGNAQARLGLADVWLWQGVVDDDGAALVRAETVLTALIAACPDSPGAHNLARLVAVERGRAAPAAGRP